MASRTVAGPDWNRVARTALTMLGVAVGIIASPNLALLLVAVVAALAAVSTITDMAPADVAVRLALSTLLLLAHPVLTLADGRAADATAALFAPACLAGAWALARLAARQVTIIDLTDDARPRVRRLPASRVEAEDRSGWVDPPLASPGPTRRPVRDPWHVAGRSGAP